MAYGDAADYGDQGELEKAGAIVDRLYEKRERFGPRERLYIDWYRARLEGRHLDALAPLRELERVAPHDIMVKWLIGNVTSRMNRPGETIQAMTPILLRWARNFAPATRAWPLHFVAAAHHLLGEFEMELQRVREAWPSLPQEQSLRVSEARALVGLGRLHDLDRLIAETVALPGAGQTPGDVMEEAVAELRVHGHRAAALALAGKAVAWRQGLAPQAATTEAAHYGLARALYQAERWEEARALFVKLGAERPAKLEYQRYLGALAARLGNRTDAMQISQAFERRTGRYLLGGPTYYRAVIAALLGERDQAVALLQRAFAEGRPCDITVHHDMDLEPLRDYPPFQEFLRPKG